MVTGAALTVVVHPEDRSPRAPEIWKHLLRRLARVVDPACDTRPARLSIEDPGAGGGVRGSRLLQREPDPALVRALATALRGGKVVVLHVDGDTSWSRRAESKTEQLLRERLIAAITMTLRDTINRTLRDRPREDQTSGPPTPHRIRGRPRPAAAAPPPDLAERVDALVGEDLAGLVVLVPHYAVEAWLYQATERAAELCRTLHEGRHVGQFETWRRERATLDEVDRLPDVVCLGREHNEVLAQALTNDDVRQVVAAGTSMAAAVERLRGCPRFVTGLGRTYELQPEGGPTDGPTTGYGD